MEVAWDALMVAGVGVGWGWDGGGVLVALCVCNGLVFYILIFQGVWYHVC